MGDFWVFGYGSLIWKPGFEFLEEQKAVLTGWHRSLCVHSWVHRGTQENPGLVLGLDKGGSCEGLARYVSGDKREAVIEYLRERELVTHVYLEQWVDIKLQNGEMTKALTFVVDRGHHQYASGLDESHQIEIVRGAVGKSGNNIDYVASTVLSLKQLNICDPVLERIVEQLTADPRTYPLKTDRLKDKDIH
ncbi:MAG: gamma-glutamylcyclotransferase [Salaquimonas sp.]